MSEEKEILFEVMTPLGFQVRVTKAYWELIVTIKHPVMAGREEDVKMALAQPEANRMKWSSCFTRKNVKNAGFALCPSRQVQKAF